MQYSSGDPVKAEQHHRCALEINTLRRELRTKEIISAEELTVMSRRYDEILQRYEVNHEPVDFEKYKLEHPEEYPKLGTKNERDILEKDIKKGSSLGVWLFRLITALFLGILSSLAANAVYDEAGVTSRTHIERLFNHRADSP